MRELPPRPWNLLRFFISARPTGPYCQPAATLELLRLAEYAERLGYAYSTLLMRAFADVRERFAEDLVWRAEALGVRMNLFDHGDQATARGGRRFGERGCCRAIRDLCETGSSLESVAPEGAGARPSAGYC